jgi:type 1 fimbria pilin
MRATLSVTLCLALLLVSAFTLAAADKEVTLSGKVTCTKCDLKKGKDCETVVVVKESGKDVMYYLDAKSGKANHDAICQGGKDGSVTGVVSEKGGKKVITASKVDLK